MKMLRHRLPGDFHPFGKARNRKWLTRAQASH
jgi:hypothetical protein